MTEECSALCSRPEGNYRKACAGGSDVGLGELTEPVVGLWVLSYLAPAACAVAPHRGGCRYRCLPTASAAAGVTDSASSIKR